MSEAMRLCDIDNFIPTIANTLIEIVDLSKCLKFDSPDALSQNITQAEINELFNQDEGNTNTRVFYQPFNDRTISEKRSELRIYFPYIDPINFTLSDVTIGFDIVVHNGLWKLNDEVSRQRPIKILKLILEKLNGIDIGGSTDLVMDGKCRLVFYNENFTGYSFTMKTKSR